MEYFLHLRYKVFLLIPKILAAFDIFELQELMVLIIA
jgi:hypothetical protein